MLIRKQADTLDHHRGNMFESTRKRAVSGVLHRWHVKKVTPCSGGPLSDAVKDQAGRSVPAPPCPEDTPRPLLLRSWTVFLLDFFAFVGEGPLPVERLQLFTNVLGYLVDLEVFKDVHA